MRTRALVLLSTCLLATACGSTTEMPDSGGAMDSGASDAGGHDAGTSDAGQPDAGDVDAGTADAGSADAGGPDAGSPDAGQPDAGTADAGCPPATPPLVLPGGTLTPRPTGSALRLTFLYQDTLFAIESARGVDMVLPGSQGPFTPGVNSGYWVETRDAADQALYTRTFQAPTSIEGVLPDGGFARTTLPLCTPKHINVDVPNNPLAKRLVVFGSPYGTFDGAVELARFTLP